ncbi:MAG: PAS domain-containing protein [Gammaproteobacteria bacterium]|nr:PAS domain-containing protein [Gammaproteobacteria bacterium]
MSEVGRASWWHDAPIAIKGNVWTIPRLFFGYRLLIATLLCLAFFGHWGPTFLGQHSPSLFAVTAALYLGLVGTSGLLLLRRAPAVNLQSGLMVTVDIVCITLLLYASGGVQTGLGMLIAISIATGGLMLPGRIALLFAALSTLAVLSQQTIATLSGDLPVSGYPQAGMLGFAFFAIATLALVLSQRASRSEAVISQQRLDLANLEQLNDYVIQHMQTGILVVDGDNRLRLINDAAWYLLGMPDAKSDRPIRQFCPPLAEKLEQWKNRRSSDSGSFRPTSDGRELKPGFSPLGESGNEGTVIFVEDEALVTQQAQQMKLASLGRLTASIAHEIRNPLGAIGHAGQLLQESEQLSPPDKRLLEIIATNTHRVNEIIENVLQLSRRHQSRPEEFLLRDWLLEFVQECIDYHQLPAESFSIAIDPTATLVFADRSQLRQILSNLCENSVRHFHGDPTALKLAFKGGITRASGGPFLDLTDNGPGIDPELRKQIFEPFFTTNTKGTGLGLYIARELSESNRMRLEYLPLEGGGSCFRMNFPGTRARRSET